MNSTAVTKAVTKAVTTVTTETDKHVVLRYCPPFSYLNLVVDSYEHGV